MKISNSFSKDKILLLLPVILVMLLDLIFTLFGQPDYYWQNHSLFNEGSPLGQILMLNPAVFIAAFVFYIAFVIFLSAILPKPLNIVFALSFYLGHVWGSSTWLETIFYKLTGNYYAGDAWYLNIFYFIFIAAISGLCVSKWLKIKCGK
jgi:hypothetical protein